MKQDGTYRELVDDIDRCLPQTQCTRCGYPRCLAYAEALAAGETKINRCPPGGETTIAALADLLEEARLPLDSSCGTRTPRVVAKIDESRCIGCTLCLDACPVDALVGAKNLMHTVIADECTGCELCLPPCPVDCIELKRVPSPEPVADARWPEYSPTFVSRARARNAAKLERLSRRESDKRLNRQHRVASRNPEALKDEILSAVQRVRERRTQYRKGHERR